MTAPESVCFCDGGCGSSVKKGPYSKGIFNFVGYRCSPCQKAAVAQKEELMDKYSVDVDADKTKTASEGKTCPECGAKLDENSSVPRCPTHGTKPFEKELPDASER